ncbi:hypothetical protein D6779_08615 [Candidatus Parcubacteria bacterium]|nr:MAG: hypothetical protein D6779_08615 [Candidatus Parcubacteria bacterium]
MTCHFRSTGEELEQDRAQVLKTLKTWGLLGGLGARARHGLGSVQIQSLYQDGEEVETFSTSEEARRAIQSLFEEAAVVEELPPFTALSAMASCHVLEGQRVRDLLDEVATKLSGYRSGISEDKAQVIRFAKSGTIDPNYPKRAVFGLPHNYFFMNEGRKVDIQGYHQDEEKPLRRASPLFIHAGQFEDGAAVILTLLPADFLPVNAKLQLEAKVKHGRNWKLERRGYNDFAPDWNVIKAFLYDTLDTQKVWPK